MKLDYNVLILGPNGMFLFNRNLGNLFFTQSLNDDEH